MSKVAERVRLGQCDLFVGSGISTLSGVPSWKDILDPLAKDIGIHLQDEMDLPLLAQFIVNENAGNRSHLKYYLDAAFEQNYRPNKYHDAIARMNVDTVWTTNYDDLLEKCFMDRNPRVIHCDADLATPRQRKKLEILKLHGSILSNVNDIVLTQDDYDRFRFTRQAMAHRLRQSLMNRSFLFIGYGYRDPDIKEIMSEARHLMIETTLNHYMIIFWEENKEGDEERRWFSLWRRELNRVGIRELVVSSIDEYAAVLNEIVLRSRGNSVYVTGSHTVDNSDSAFSLGRQLAESDIVLNFGQSEGIGASVYMGYVQQLIVQNAEFAERVKIYPNPYAADPAYSNDETLIRILKRERRSLIGSSRVVVVFPGGIGTQAEVELAKTLGCIVLPVALEAKDYENEVIGRVCKNEDLLRRIEESCCETYYRAIKDHSSMGIDSVAQQVSEIVGRE